MAKTRNKRHPFRTMLAALLFVVCVTAFGLGCRYKIQSLNAQTEDLDKQITKLEQQLEDEKEAQLEGRVQKTYEQSDSYKEQLARKQFNLIFPGERLYVVD